MKDTSLTVQMCSSRGVGAADMPALWSHVIGWEQSSNVQMVLKLED